MAWPTEAGALLSGVTGRRKRRRDPGGRSAVVQPIYVPRRPRSRVVDPSVHRGRYYLDLRGLHRFHEPATYRFYRSDWAPPTEDDAPFATNATLPHTPTDVYANGTWWLSVSYWNGMLDSGFLPVGPAGETYIRLDIVGGSSEDLPPNAPNDWRLELRPGGVVRVVGLYFQIGNLRATQWAIAYTTDGGDPPADTPDITQVMQRAGLGVLEYDLPGQNHGTTVKVRLQTRRPDGENWVYSENPNILTATADAEGPAVPKAGDRWAGRLPEEL